MPEPDGDAIEGGFFQTEGPDGEVTLRSAQGNTFQKKTMRLPAGYRSPTLRATFLAQWMYII